MCILQIICFWLFRSFFLKLFVLALWVILSQIVSFGFPELHLKSMCFGFLEVNLQIVCLGLLDVHFIDCLFWLSGSAL